MKNSKTVGSVFKMEIFEIFPFFQIFSLWAAEGHKVYELYTSATGLYLCLLSARAVIIFATWLKQVS